MLTTIHNIRELPPHMQGNEQEWCLLCLMESGSATYETTTDPISNRCVSDKRHERWERNGDRR